MLLKDIKNYMQTNINSPHWSIGAIDITKEKTIAILGKEYNSKPIALGGMKNATYKTKTIEIVIRWNDEEEAERMAQQMYDMFALQPKIVNGIDIITCVIKNDTPVNTVVSQSGAIEYRSEITITYKEKEN